MATISSSGRQADVQGNQLMLADSHAASNNFGMSGATFLNVPKSKFLFYIKFFRANAQNLPEWSKGVGFAIKNIDRPRVSFRQETLNQYNRKRVVQMGHDFEPLQLRFHDTSNPSLRNMFTQYYQYYYGDSKLNGASTSVYDVVTSSPFELGQWGFHPPLAAKEYGYFFSHISVWQFFGGQMERFDLINPKISSYNPDDFDTAVFNLPNEIQVSIDFEGIVYHDLEPLSSDIAAEAGLSGTGLQYWDINDAVQTSVNAGNLTNGSTGQSLGTSTANVLLQNLASAATGQGSSSLGGIVASIAGNYDANRGLAVGNTALKSIKDLVSGNTQSATQGGQGLLKGLLFGKPGGLF